MAVKPAEPKAFTAPKLRVGWDEDAACGSADPSLFFIDRDEDDDDADETGPERYLKAITHFCHRCDVRPECLTATLAAEPKGNNRQGRHGVAGALTPTQRAEPGLREIVLSGRLPPLPKVTVSTGKRRKKRTNPAGPSHCHHCGDLVPPAAARRPDVNAWCKKPECQAAAKSAANERQKAARKARVAEWVALQKTAA